MTRQIKYIIEKSCRANTGRTYTGPTWELAGLISPTLRKGMDRHADYFYENKVDALREADILSGYNPAGFRVEEV
jgi:hypothetical protein